MISFVAISLVLLFVLSSYQEKVRFDNHSVLHVNVTSEKERNLLFQLKEQLNLDVWSFDSNIVIGNNDLRVSPEQKKLIEQVGLSHNVWIENVQDLIDAEEKQNEINRKKKQSNYFDSYHTFSEIVERLQGYTSYDFVTMESVGKSHENRDIWLVKFALDSPNRPANKPTIFVSGSMHAREWISAPTVQWIMEQILTGFDTKDPDVMFLLEGLDFYWIPVINPDGLQYTKTNNRLWRKNRRQNSATVYGVDCNRNFDIMWGQGGSSSNPSSDTYRGPTVASEPEVQAVSKTFDSIVFPVGGIDYHSYSQLILRSWGYTNANTPGETINQQVGAEMRQRILQKYGRSYTNQKSIQLYLTTGTASDYYYSKGQPKNNDMLAYTFELRDTGQYGFVLPPSQIIPTGEENWDAFLYFAEVSIPGNRRKQ